MGRAASFSVQEIEQAVINKEYDMMFKVAHAIPGICSKEKCYEELTVLEVL